MSWRCRACLTVNGAGAPRCSGCGAVLGSVAAPAAAPGRGFALGFGAVLLLGVGVLAGLWFGRGEAAPETGRAPVAALPEPAASRATTPPAPAEPQAQPERPPSFAILQVRHPRYDPFKVPAVVVGEPPRLLAALGPLTGMTDVVPTWPEGLRITGVVGASEEHGFVLFAVASERPLRALRVGPFQLPQAVDILAFRGADPPRGVQATQLVVDERGRRQVLFDPAVAAPAVALVGDQALALLQEDGKGLALDHVGAFLARPMAWTMAEFRAQFFARDPDYLLAEGLVAALAGRNEDAVRLLLAALAADATLRSRVLVPLENSALAAGQDHLGRGDGAGALEILQGVVQALPERAALLSLAVEACLATGALTQALPLWRRLPHGAERTRLQGLLLAAVLQRAMAALERNQAAEAAALLEAFVQEFPDQAPLLLALARARAALGQLSEAIAAAERAQALDPGLQREVAALRESLTVQGGDSLRIPMDRESRAILTTLWAGGQSLECLVDTGASMTTVPTALAQALGVLKPGSPTMRVETAGGMVDAPTAVLPHIRLGSFELRALRVLVLDLPGGLAGKGLIGLNLLNRFDFHVDQEAGVLVLERKRGRR